MTELLNRLKSWFLSLTRDQKIATMAIVIPSVIALISILLGVLKKPEANVSIIDSSSNEVVKNQKNDNNSIKTNISDSVNTTTVGDVSLNSTFSNNTFNLSFGEKKQLKEDPKISTGYPELKISGVVLNDKNEVIKDAVVEIPSYGIRRMTTDINGKFVIHKATMTDDKDAELKVFKDGYRTKTKTVDLNNENIQVILKGR